MVYIQWINLVYVITRRLGEFSTLANFPFTKLPHFNWLGHLDATKECCFFSQVNLENVFDSPMNFLSLKEIKKKKVMKKEETN